MSLFSLKNLVRLGLGGSLELFFSSCDFEGLYCVDWAWLLLGHVRFPLICKKA